MNPLFPGIREKLKNLGHQPWAIVTTKQERFVAQILAANDINLPDNCIYGLDRQLSKEAVLSELLGKNPQQSIHFVEDDYPLCSMSSPTTDFLHSPCRMLYGVIIPPRINLPPSQNNVFIPLPLTNSFKTRPIDKSITRQAILSLPLFSIRNQHP
jgi:hypothetical protein